MLELAEFSTLVTELRQFQSGQTSPSRNAESRPIAPASMLPANSNAASDEVKRVFNLFDSDASGAIDYRELQAALENTWQPDREEISVSTGAIFVAQ